MRRSLYVLCLKKQEVAIELKCLFGTCSWFFWLLGVCLFVGFEGMFGGCLFGVFFPLEYQRGKNFQVN